MGQVYQEFVVVRHIFARVHVFIDDSDKFKGVFGLNHVFSDTVAVDAIFLEVFQVSDAGLALLR